MLRKWNSFRNSDFSRLFASLFISELGGYLTNTVILIYIFQETGGNKFYLGLSQVLFVAPIALGTLVGGAIGEIFNRRLVMLLCEVCNLFLVVGLILSDNVLAIIMVRGLIVFFAGVYTPSRQAIVQELVPEKHLRSANAAVMTIYAVLQSIGPLLGAYAFSYFGGVSEVFLTNLATYFVASIFLFHMRYSPIPEVQRNGISFKQICGDIVDGFNHIRARKDLFALIKNFSIGGICLGVFYPTLLPFLAEVFNGDEKMYGQVLGAFGVGGVCGGLAAVFCMRHFSKGKILVVTAAVEAVLLLIWTQIDQYLLSIGMIFVWGMGMVLLATTYINYIQVNVSKAYHSRAFSLYDQSISLSVIVGAGIVAVVGDRLTASELLTYTALGAALFILGRITSSGMRSLFWMET